MTDTTTIRRVTWAALIFRDHVEPAPITLGRYLLRPTWKDAPAGVILRGAMLGAVLDHEAVVKGMDERTVMNHLRAIVAAEVKLGIDHGIDIIANPRPASPGDRAIWATAREIDRIVTVIPEVAEITLVVRQTEKVLTFIPEPAPS